MNKIIGLTFGFLLLAIGILLLVPEAYAVGDVGFYIAGCEFVFFSGLILGITYMKYYYERER